MPSENTKNASMEPIKIADLELRGEFAHRAIMNYARLEGHWYLPHEVFSADQHGWPGDWEGRIILALALHAQVSRREPAWLDEILDQLPARLIENGYFGPVPPEGKINEQQISGHSWLPRGLLECHAWRGDERALRQAERIVVPFYADATARLELASGTITLKEASAYPHGDVNRFEVLTTDATADVTIECFAPSWIAADAVWVKRNGETMPHVHEGGFVKIRGRFEKGDVLEFHLPVRTFAQDTINALSLPGYHTLRHGPMILARAGKEELAVARDARLVREAETAFRVAGTDVVLTPIHSRFDLTKEDSWLQVLFRD